MTKLSYMATYGHWIINIIEVFAEYWIVIVAEKCNVDQFSDMIRKWIVHNAGQYLKQHNSIYCQLFITI